MNLVRATEEQRAEGVSEILGETDVLALLGLVVEGEDDGGAASGDLGPDETVGVDDLVRGELRELRDRLVAVALHERGLDDAGVAAAERTARIRSLREMPQGET